MPQVNVVVAHTLDPQEAVKRIKTELEEIQIRHANVMCQCDFLWDGNTTPFSVTILGVPISGTLEVADSEVRLSGELPWKAVLFRGRAEELIKERLESLLK